MSSRPTRPGSPAWTALRWTSAALVLLVLTLGLASPAQAHASLVSTDPAEGEVLAEAPEELRLVFDEPVRITEDTVQLFDATGDARETAVRTEDADVVAVPADVLGDGTYVMSWRVVSTDGHPVAGSLTFSVGAPSESVVTPDVDQDAPRTTTTALGAAQGLHYAALLLAAGLVVFLVAVLPRSPVVRRARARLAAVVAGLAALATLAGLCLLPLSALYRSGGGLSDLASAVAWQGHLASWALPALGISVVGLLLAALVARRAEPPAWMLLAPLIALVGPVAVGHTRAYGPVPLVMAADLVHLAAAATWVGGLVGLVLVLPSLLPRERLAGQALSRFSSVAALTLVAVAFTGSFLGWRILGSWTALVTTAYGWILLAKLALVALAVGVAAYNRFRLLPAVEGTGGHDTRVHRGGVLRRAVRVEGLGLVVVLLLTGFLVNQPPTTATGQAPAGGARDHVVGTATAGDVRVLAHLTPGVRGRNVVTIDLQDGAGDPLVPFAEPTISVSGPSVDLGEQRIVAVGPGTYRSEVVIPSAGDWEIQVSVRLDEFDNPVLVVPVRIGDR